MKLKPELRLIYAMSDGTSFTEDVTPSPRTILEASRDYQKVHRADLVVAVDIRTGETSTGRPTITPVSINRRPLI